MAAIEGERRKLYAKIESTFISYAYIKNPGPKTGAQLPGGQQLPGDRSDNQVADAGAGRKTSAKPSMQ